MQQRHGKEETLLISSELYMKLIILKKMKKFEKGVAFWQQLIYNTICVEEHETQKQKNARLAQLVEHLTLNQGVQGSNP